MSEETKIKNEIIQIYLFTKFYLDNKYILSDRNILENLKNLNIETILSYLKESIEFLLSKINSHKGDKMIKMKSRDDNLNESYEKYMRKLEQDIRNHIRIENELKIEIEFLQSKLENHERNFAKVSKKSKSQEWQSFGNPSQIQNFLNHEKYFENKNEVFAPSTNRKENEILILRAENTNLKNTIQTLEQKLENSKLSAKRSEEKCEKYLSELETLKEEMDKVIQLNKNCNCEETSIKFNKLQDDFILINSQNDFYSKMVKI
jgi:hypothetical protein